MKYLAILFLSVSCAFGQRVIISPIIPATGGSSSSSGSITGTTNFFNLSVNAFHPPNTNYPGVDPGWPAWELVYAETNAEGIRTNLTANWQFLIPPDFTTNLTLLINYSLLNTNGPNTSNVIWGASIINIRSGTTNNVHTNALGSVVWGTNNWIAKYDGTNIVTNLVINLSSTYTFSPGDLAIMQLQRNAFNDTFGGAVALHALQGAYTR